MGFTNYPAKLRLRRLQNRVDYLMPRASAKRYFLIHSGKWRRYAYFCTFLYIHVHSDIIEFRLVSQWLTAWTSAFRTDCHAWPELLQGNCSNLVLCYAVYLTSDENAESLMALSNFYELLQWLWTVITGKCLGSRNSFKTPECRSAFVIWVFKLTRASILKGFWSTGSWHHRCIRLTLLWKQTQQFGCSARALLTPSVPTIKYFCPCR